MQLREDRRIPVFLITGFLGAGKTTILLSLMAAGRLNDTLLIINEVGEVGVDQNLLQDSDLDAPVLLPGGCMCCSLKGDLGYTLRDIELRLERGLAKQFRRVVIETTGIADPAPILRTILTDRWVSARYRVGRSVAVADAQYLVQTCRESEVSLSQLVHADTVLLSKTDIVTDEQRTVALSHLATWAGDAELLDARVALAAGWTLEPTVSVMARGFAAEICCRLHAYQLIAGEYPHGIRTLEVAIREQIPWAVFSEAVDAFSTSNSNTLLRMKGFASIREIPKAVCVQSVRTTFYPPQLLDLANDLPGLNTMTIIYRGELCGTSLEEFRRGVGPSCFSETPADQRIELMGWMPPPAGIGV
jgi:G3E family GTPase